jgi:hypothetical protein
MIGPFARRAGSVRDGPTLKEPAPEADGLPACAARNVWHRGKWQDAALLEHEDKDDGDHEDALNRVHDDAHPGALEALRRIGLEKDAIDQGGRYDPRLVQVIEGE